MHVPVKCIGENNW